MARFSPTLEAILLMLLSTACFSAMNIVIRMASSGLDSTQMVFMRNIFSLGLVLAWYMVLNRSWPRFPTRRPMGHFWRATFGFVAMEFWFYAITLLPLPLATALSFITPIFATIIAILFLGEKAGLRRWGAVMTGFIGMLIILRPWGDDVGPDALFVVASASLMAVAATLVKSLSRTEPPETIVFYMALFMIPWSALPALPNLQPMDGHQLWLLFLVALFSTMAHLFLARAYQRADMTLLMPFDFMRLVFTAIFAYILFGETLDMPTVLGSLVIVASSVYITHRETKLKPGSVPPPLPPAS